MCLPYIHSFNPVIVIFHYFLYRNGSVTWSDAATYVSGRRIRQDDKQKLELINTDEMWQLRYGSTADVPIVSFMSFIWQKAHVDARDALLASIFMLQQAVVRQRRRVEQTDDDRRRDNGNHRVTLSAQRQRPNWMHHGQ